jgi:hypothetical protein
VIAQPADVPSLVTICWERGQQFLEQTQELFSL